MSTLPGVEDLQTEAFEIKIKGSSDPVLLPKREVELTWYQCAGGRDCDDYWCLSRLLSHLEAEMGPMGRDQLVCPSHGGLWSDFGNLP